MGVLWRVRRGLVALTLVVQLAAASDAPPVRWGNVDGRTDTHVTATGDALTAHGVDLHVETGSLGGAIATMPADTLRGHDVVLAGQLRVVEGAGSAFLWVRADEGYGFINSQNAGVAHADGRVSRELRLYIPSATRTVSFGAVNGAAGVMEVEGLRLQAVESAAPTVSTRSILAPMLDAAQVRALNAARVDWVGLRARVLTGDLASLPNAEAYARFRDIARALNDHHSFALSPRATAGYTAEARPTAPVTTWVRDRVGYVAVPGVRGTDADAGARFARELCASLTAMRRDAAKGWIVDLRGDDGGNMWPMLGGLVPLLGTDRPGAFQHAGGTTDPWRVMRPEGCTWTAKRARIAVLIGPRTASSGEAVAVAFRGRQGVRFFGAPTAGVSTSNERFPLPDGGSVWITTAVDVDRAGTAYPAGIAPDEPAEDGDAGVEAAQRWLTTRATR